MKIDFTEIELWIVLNTMIFEKEFRTQESKKSKTKIDKELYKNHIIDVESIISKINKALGRA